MPALDEYDMIDRHQVVAMNEGQLSVIRRDFESMFR